MATLLDQAPKGLRYLSLDCFDTLVWRNVQAPRDVFADLRVAGGGVGPRMWAEKRARKAAKFNRQWAEVSIEEIYRSMMPTASDAEIGEAVQRELEAEARHCYGFQPVLDLMRDAKARGLGIIVVSDTYLSESQLRTLIGRAAGEEALKLVDRIFCSSEHGMSKGEGLFKPVLKALNVSPDAILHVGDNINADQVAPSLLGIRTAHFKQFDAACDRRLRLEAAAAAVLDPTTRSTAPAFQPHRPLLSLRTNADPTWALGYDVMGPLMHAFAGWVKDEADALAGRLGKPVHTLFVLRDGHLPKQVFDALYPDVPTGTIEVSRFTACRSSFTDEAAIRDYLASTEEHERIDVLARQLLLTEAEGMKLARGKQGAAAQKAFSEGACSSPMVAKIVSRSAEFAQRLIAHLKLAGVAQGDAVMLVDLGYNGTVQKLIEPILTDRMGLTVAGRYLLLREEDQSGFDRRGLLDARHYDLWSLHALCSCVAVLEQMCTIAQGSVVDYTPEGQPIRRAAGLKGLQNDARDRIQEACVAFAGDARNGVVRAPDSDDADCRRRMAGAILARLLFLPQADEVAVFETFDHDVNLGTNDLVKLLDVDASAEGLRRRGLSYLNDVGRMYLPGELQAHGLPLNLSLFSVSRLGLDLRSSDFSARSIKIPVILADERGQAAIEVEAHPTHDGYYMAAIPVGAARFTVGVQLGAVCEWVQIEEAVFHDVEAFGKPRHKGPAVPAQPIHEGMEEAASGMFRCDGNALMLAPPPIGTGEKPLLLALVFRPLVWRSQANEMRKAA